MVSLLYLQLTWRDSRLKWTDTAHIDRREPVEFHMLTCLIKDSYDKFGVQGAQCDRSTETLVGC